MLGVLGYLVKWHYAWFMESKIPPVGLIAVGCGLAFPAEINITNTTDLPEGFEVNVNVRYSPEQARYVLHSLAITGTGPMSEVNGTVLRTLPVHRYLQEATSNLYFWNLDDELFSSKPAEHVLVENAEYFIKQGPSPETLAVVVQIYRIAEILNLKTALHVQKSFGIPYATAGSWIARAKAQRLFPSEESIMADQERLIEQIPKIVEAFNPGGK